MHVKELALFPVTEKQAAALFVDVNVCANRQCEGMLHPYLCLSCPPSSCVRIWAWPFSLLVRVRHIVLVCSSVAACTWSFREPCLNGM